MREQRPVIVLEGGLGNQLFQFAYGLTLAETPVVLDNRRRITWGQPLGEVLHQSAWRPVTFTELLHGWQCPRLPRGQRTAVAYWNHTFRRLANSHVTKAVDERSPAALAGYRNIVFIEGYFQDESFVDSVRSAFLSSLNPLLLTPHQGMAAEANNVGISLRLGRDYEEFGIRLPDSYYRRALKRLTASCVKPVIHVCSDDAAQAARFLDSLSLNCSVIDHSTEAPIDQLRVMASVEKLAISNSSFAWWGAWLGDQLGRHSGGVLCPDRWLAANDSVPSSRWTRVPID